MNIRKLISAALLISLITVAVPTPLDRKAEAGDYSLLVPASLFALAVAATGAKIYYTISNKHSLNEQDERHSTLNVIIAASSLAAGFTLCVMGNAYTQACADVKNVKA
jgi:hypothetical protein